MDKKEFVKKMENLQSPDFVNEIHKRQLKLTLLNTRKSATFGVLLLLTPFLFAPSVVL